MASKKNKATNSSPAFIGQHLMGNTDEYEMEEDYDLDETGEDTDDASENEASYTPRRPSKSSVPPMKNEHERYDTSEPPSGQNMDIREQVYQEQLANLKEQLRQLRDLVHPEYTNRINKIELSYKERIRLNILWRDYSIELVEKEHIKEKKLALKEFEEKEIELKENLLAHLEEKRKLIEADRQSITITGDPSDPKPVLTRKLRRRPHEPAPPPEKRRKVVPSQLIFLLDDKEIESDLREIAKGSLTPITPKKASATDIRVEDGKLWYERRWYHRGQSVFVEGKNLKRFPANVTSVSSDVVWVKKTADGSKFKIFVSQLSKGNVSIKRRAAT